MFIRFQGIKSNDPMLTRLIDPALVGNRELKILAKDVQIAYSLFCGIADKHKLLIKDDGHEPLSQIVEHKAC